MLYILKCPSLQPTVFSDVSFHQRCIKMTKTDNELNEPHVNADSWYRDAYLKAMKFISEKVTIMVKLKVLCKASSINYFG